MKYRKKPVVIEAFRWTVGEDQTEDPIWFVDAINRGDILFSSNGNMVIKTLEGWMYAISGDYIIKGIKGELYPCKPDIFEASYEQLCDD